ncbi:hypothetical protein [Nostocoides australiense]
MSNRKSVSIDLLTPARLAADGQFRALAALAHAQSAAPHEAVSLLAQNAGKRDALAWLFALGLNEDQWQVVAGSLPEGVPLDESTGRAFKRAVADVVTLPVSQRTIALAKLLTATPLNEVRREAAREVFKGGEGAGVLHDAAAKVLGTSDDARDRALLVKATEKAPTLAERLARVDALGPLDGRNEWKVGTDLLTALAGVQESVDSAAVGRVAGRIDQRKVTRWFFGSAWAPGQCDRVITAEFGKELGVDGVLGLVRDGLTPDQSQVRVRGGERP